MAVQTLTVNGDGTTTSGWAAEGGTYTRLQTDDGDTTRLYTPTSGDVRQVTVTDTSGLSGATINSVTVYAKTRSLDPVSNTFQIGVRTHSTDYWSSDKDTVTSTSYILFSNTWTTNPNTLSAWTTTEIDALEIGAKKTNGVGMGWTYAYVEVDYTAATTIAFDAAGNSGDQAAASSYSGSASWSGTNRALTIDVSMLGAGVTVTAMTYGGANCTFIGAQSTVTSFGRVESWRILSSDSGAPAAGANTLAVTLSGSLEFSVEWVSYTNVHQTSPTEGFNSAQATNTGSATDASVVVTTVADNDWVHAAAVANDTSITAGNTTRNNISGTLGSGANEDNNAPKTPAGNVTMSYSGMGITTTWAIVGYALRDINAVSLTSTTRLRSLLGVGL